MQRHKMKIEIRLTARRQAVAALLYAMGLLALASAAACTPAEPPSAAFSMGVAAGPAPLEVQFLPDETGEEAAFAWEFGDGATSNERSPQHTFLDAGELTVRLTVTQGSLSASEETTVSVLPGPAGWIEIEPQEVDLITLETAKFTAAAYDELGNPIPQAEVTWKAAPAVGKIDSSGLFTAAGLDGEFPLAIEAEFERLGKSASGSASVNVRLGPMASLEVEGGEFTLAPGQRAGLFAVARDAAGNALTEAEFQWEALRQGDQVDSTGSFRAATTPTDGPQTLVKVTATLDGRSMSADVNGTVTHGIIDRVEVTPAEVELGLKGTQPFRLEAFDRFGNPVVADNVEWSLLDPEIGEIDDEGMFTAGTLAGEFSDGELAVRAAKDGVVSTAKVNLTIEPGPAVELQIGPDGDSVPAGASSPLLAYVVDEHGNQIYDAPVIWSASEGGRVTENGVFVAAFDSGDFPDAVSAALPVGSSGNRTELTASMSISVRQRSSDFLAFEVLDGDGGAIYLLDLALSNLTPLSEELAENDARETAPAWTPDGLWLLYSSDLDGTDQIYVIDPHGGGGGVKLTDDPDGATQPAVSPTGKEFAYVAVVGEKWQVYVAPMPQPDGETVELVTRADVTRVSADEELRYAIPRWSPDGESLAMSAIDDDGNISIRIVSREGKGEVPVLGSEESELAFDWTADGKGLLLGERTGDPGFVLMSVGRGGGDRNPAVDLPFNVSRAFWSPDRSEVAVIEAVEGGLWLADSDGTGLRPVVRAGAVPKRLDWRPLRSAQGNESQ